MLAVKIRQDEMEIVKQAATRVERRNNSRFIMDQARVEIADDKWQPSHEANEDESDPPALFE